MKRICIFLAVFLLLGLLSGCGREAQSGGYQIYYTDAEAAKFLTETYVPQKTSTMEVVWELLTKMKNPASATEQRYSLLPSEVEIQNAELTEEQLTVTFNAAYSRMDSAREVLLRAGLVKTVTQLDEVKRVVFHIGEEVLRDSAGDPVGAMTASMFITSPVGVNSYQFAQLALYFSTPSGDRIQREMRNVHYASNSSLEKIVMEQLLKGPMTGSALAVFPENVRVLGIYVDGKACTLNLSTEFLEEVPGVEPKVTVYAIVNSLCDVLGVETVQFQVDGSSDIQYRDQLSLAGPFHRNSELIATDSGSVEETTETVAEPDVGL